MAAKTPIPASICASGELPELGKYAFTVNYRGERQPALLIRFHGTVYGYLNRCVHMPKRLDCEESNIFDATGRFLRCSMHTIHYDPPTGECLSEICAGKSLTALKVEEREGRVYLMDKRAVLADGE